MAITNATIGTTAAAIYTSASANGDAITSVIVCNTAEFDPNNPTAGQVKLFYTLFHQLDQLPPLRLTPL